MLLSQFAKVDQISEAIRNEQSENIAKLYAQLNTRLNEIAAQLQSDLENAQESLIKRSDSAQERNEAKLNDYLRNELLKIKSAYSESVKSEINAIADEYGSKLSETLQKELQNKLSNLSNFIDINEIVDRIKSQDLLRSIIDMCVKSTNDELAKFHSAITDAALNQLNSKIEVNDVIENLLRSEVTRNAISAAVDSKASAAIESMIESKNTQIQSQIQSNLDRFLAQIADKFTTQMDNLIASANAEYTGDLRAKTNEVKEQLSLYKDSWFKEQESSLKGDMDSFARGLITQYLEEIKASAQSRINIDEIQNAVISSSVEKIYEKNTEIKEKVVDEVKAVILNNENFLQKISNELLKSETIATIVNDAALNYAKQNLASASLKEHMALILKERAKEIFDNQNQLNAQAESQAILVAMRTQAQAMEITSEMNGMIANQKINDLDIALQEAKDVLVEELRNLSGLSIETLREKYEDLASSIAIFKAIQDDLQRQDKLMAGEIAGIKESLKGIVNEAIDSAGGSNVSSDSGVENPGGNSSKGYLTWQ